MSFQAIGKGNAIRSEETPRFARGDKKMGARSDRKGVRGDIPTLSFRALARNLPVVGKD
jgi:hypothetical protein